MEPTQPKPHRLSLVPAAEPTPAQAAIERVKRMPNPRNELQCPTCGSRTYLVVRNGAHMDGGKLVHGALVDRMLCADCYRRGRTRGILPTELKAI